MRALLMTLLITGLLGGCVGIPDGTRAVQPFDLDRYLGRWYEIARLDHRFEQGLDCVTATYRLRDDGGVSVVNRGVDLSEGKASEAVGKAYFVKGDNRGRFKVSFFGPFYAGYNILALANDYSTALIGGNDRGYLWILARTLTLPEAEQASLLKQAAAMGFDTSKLVYPQQGSVCTPYRQDKAANTPA